MDSSAGDVIWGAFTLDPNAYRALQDSNHVLRISVVLLVLAGLCWTAGHCAILFLNRVPRGRLLRTTAALTCSFIVGVLIWVASTWVVASLLFGNDRVPLWKILPIAAFGYAPLVLGVLIIIPYIGTGIETLLNTWTLLALVLAVSAAFELSIVEALVSAVLGWALTKLLPRLAGGHMTHIFNNAWHRVNAHQVRMQGEAAATESAARLRTR
jgi:predicted small integral membrane protein